MTERILERALIEVLNMSLTASVVILAVFAARLLLKRAPRIFSCSVRYPFRLRCPFWELSGMKQAAGAAWNILRRISDTR